MSLSRGWVARSPTCPYFRNTKERTGQEIGDAQEAAPIAGRRLLSRVAEAIEHGEDAIEERIDSLAGLGCDEAPGERELQS